LNNLVLGLTSPGLQTPRELHPDLDDAALQLWLEGAMRNINEAEEGPLPSKPEKRTSAKWIRVESRIRHKNKYNA
jgi:hypothetical protein